MGQNHQNDFSIVEKYLIIFYLIPVALLLWFVASFSVNVPFLDHWALVSFFERIAAGNANVGDFFAQHFEHRLFFPKILFAIFAFYSSWNVKLEQGFSIFLSVISFYILYKISSQNKKEDQLLFHIANLASCILFFSLVQYTNWLWGFQLAWYIINTCVILAICILKVTNNLHPNLRLLLAALCCAIASFSSAHGLLSWLAMIPSVAFVERDAKPSKIRLFIWALLFISCCAIYSIGYRSVAAADLFFFIKKPLVAVAYLLMIVGSSLGQVINPAISGFVILLNFLFLNIYYFKNYRSEFARDAAAWLSLGWFGLLFVLITTVGRVSYGLGYSLQPRYTTSSIFIVIASIHLWQLIIIHRKKWLPNSANIRSIFGFLFGVLTAIFIANSTDAIAEGRNVWLQETSGQTCLEVVRYLDKTMDESPESCLLSIVNESFKGILRKSIFTLDDLGFRNLAKDVAFTTESSKKHGNIEIPPQTEKPQIMPKNMSLKLSGWATLPDGREQPRVVLLSYGDNKSFFASAIVNLPRPDVGRMLKSGRYSRIGWDRFGWEVNIPGKLLPVGETAIKAWVYDRDNKQFVKLNGESKIKVIDN